MKKISTFLSLCLLCGCSTPTSKPVDNGASNESIAPPAANAPYKFHSFIQPAVAIVPGRSFLFTLTPPANFTVLAGNIRWPLSQWITVASGTGILEVPEQTLAVITNTVPLMWVQHLAFDAVTNADGYWLFCNTNLVIDVQTNTSPIVSIPNSLNTYWVESYATIPVIGLVFSTASLKVSASPYPVWDTSPPVCRAIAPADSTLNIAIK